MSEVADTPPPEAVVTPPGAEASEPAAEAPSSSSETPPAAGEDAGEQASIGEVDWAGMQESIESTGDLPPAPTEPVVEPVQPTPAAAEVPAVAPVVEPVPAVAAPETPPVVDPTAAPPAVAEVPPAAAPTPAVPEPAPVAVAPPPRTGPTPEQVQAMRQQYLEVTAQQYQLSDEDAGMMVTDPKTVIPRLMAGMHANLMEQSLAAAQQMVSTMLPNYLGTYLTQRENTRTVEDEFYGQWKELEPFKDRVLPLAQMYRQANPKATKEQFFRDVGIQSWMALKMDMAGLAGKLQPAELPAPATPTAAVPASPVAIPVGHQPANPGGSGAQLPANPTSPWGNLADQWIDPTEEDF